MYPEAKPIAYGPLLGLTRVCYSLPGKIMDEFKCFFRIHRTFSHKCRKDTRIVVHLIGSVCSHIIMKNFQMHQNHVSCHMSLQEKKIEKEKAAKLRIIKKKGNHSSNHSC